MDADTFTLLMNKLDDTDKDMELLRKEIHDLRKDLKSLNAFKWRVYGIVSLLGFGLPILMNYYLRG